MNWANYQKNASVLLTDIYIEGHYNVGDFVSENSEPLFCKLEDGVVFNTDLPMVIFHWDPMMRLFSEIIDRVVEKVNTTTGFHCACLGLNYFLGR